MSRSDRIYPQLHDHVAEGGAYSPVSIQQRMERAIDKQAKRSKYHREIKPGVYVDCYDVLKAFDVRNPALQHLIKKALAAGQRGHKDLQEDMQDIVDSAVRAKELAE